MFSRKNRKVSTERKIETKELTQAELDRLAGAGCRGCIARGGMA